MVLQQVAVKDDKNTGYGEKVQLVRGISESERVVEPEVESIATETERRIVLRDTLQKIYRAEVGVRELSGNNDGKRVEEYLAITNLGKSYAWCASFISWCFAQAGYEEPNTPWSPALFPTNRLIWPEKFHLEAVEPKKGDVFGIWFPRLGRIAHAGFVDEWGQAFIITVEGNTNEIGSAEGDGVYRRRRPIGSIHSVANWIDRP